MTLAEIYSDCMGAFGSRFQLPRAKILQHINTIQQVAFNRDLLAFLWYQDYLTVLQEVTLVSGFTPYVAADVGKTVTNGSATGTLRYFNNTTGTLLIESSDTFSGVLTTTAGTGTGTFASQAVSKGPYSWASLSPSLGSLTAFTQPAGVRRMLGVTRLTESQLLQPAVDLALLDYNFSISRGSDRAIYEDVRKFDVMKALTFVDTPSDTAETYRWVYFIRPPKIVLTTDDANLLIPEEFHQTVVVEGVGLLADRSTYGETAPEQVLEQVLTPYWDMLMQMNTPMLGGAGGGLSEGTL